MSEDKNRGNADGDIIAFFVIPIVGFILLLGLLALGLLYPPAGDLAVCLIGHLRGTVGGSCL